MLLIFCLSSENIKLSASRPPVELPIATPCSCFNFDSLKWKKLWLKTSLSSSMANGLMSSLPTLNSSRRWASASIDSLIGTLVYMSLMSAVMKIRLNFVASSPIFRILVSRSREDETTVDRCLVSGAQNSLTSLSAAYHVVLKLSTIRRPL